MSQSSQIKDRTTDEVLQEADFAFFSVRDFLHAQ